MSSFRFFIGFLVWIFLASGLFADSPLTSTYFAGAYAEHPMLAEARKADGLLNETLMEFLADKKKPLDVKLAIINELGWDIDGKTNAQTFWDYLEAEKKFKNKARFAKKARPELMICMAYLMALDDYFEVEEAAMMAQKATEKGSESYSLHLIAALIAAQQAMNTNWCQVWRVVEAVQQNETLERDLKPEAEQAIIDYIVLYQSSCD